MPSDPKRLLTDEEIANAALTGWRHADDTITAHFDTGDFATGLRLVNLIGEAAEAANHHPDILLTYPRVEVTLSSHDVRGITSRDIHLARMISGAAAALGVTD